MITPRRTRLVRVPDLHAYRAAIVHLVRESPRSESAADADAEGAAPRTLVLVPTAGARDQLARTLTDTLGTTPHARLLTRDEWYDWLHARVPHALPRLGPLERDSLAQAAAHAAAEQAHAAADAGDDEAGVPFRLRPGLVAEMLRFHDQLRRQSKGLERFNELIEMTLGGGAGDRGTDRLLTQTRFLTATFREFERRVAASAAWDEHTLRQHLLQHPLPEPPLHVIVTMADWIAEPDGLYIGDFDLLAQLPGLQQIDLVSTEQLLGSGFHERIHEWWPGIDEIEAAALLGREPLERVRPLLETPRAERDRAPLWFTCRDREEELMAVAQHVRAAHRRRDAAPLDRTAVVFKHPLPYLYLASGTLGAAGIPFTTDAALPLATEPFVATVDLVLAAAESSFARESLVELLTTPHLRVVDGGLAPAAIREFDQVLREQSYIGGIAHLSTIVDAWTSERSRPAAHAALAMASKLSPMLEAAPASVAVGRVISFLTDHLAPLAADDPLAARDVRVRAATFELLQALADAHARHHDVDWRIDDLAAGIRRWIEGQTFPPETAGRGVHLLDDRAVRYGRFDDVTIVGLVEAEWPERQARNIFYPSGLLKALGWPSEHTRRRAADARFVDLLATATRRIALSTVTLDDEAIVMRSMQLDEIPRARLATVPTADRLARITADEALATDPVSVEPLTSDAREWAAARIQRAAGSDARYHGQVGARPERAWSVSALEAYLACPFKFFAQHVLRLEEEPEDSDVMNPRQQGQFVHKVFEEFFAAWHRTGHGAITPELLEPAREVFVEVVERELKTLPEAEAGLERTRLLGSSAAAGLGEAVMRMEAERPVRVVERLLEKKLDGLVTIKTADGERTIQLRGKADRIDLLADGTFRLVDYKSGWPPQRARALQLPMYAIAAQQRLLEEQGKAWRLGEAAYLAFKGPKRVVPLFSAQAQPDEVLAEAQQRVADTLDAIARGEFPPRPEDVFLCENCSFGAVCRKDYVDG